MTQDNTKPNEELLERIKALPEDAEIPQDILEQLSKDQLMAFYVEKMIEDKHIRPTDELRKTLLEKLNNKINREIVNNLPDYLVAKLNAADESGASDADMEKMIEESGIDVETITENAMIDFRNKFLSLEKKEA